MSEELKKHKIKGYSIQIAGIFDTRVNSPVFSESIYFEDYPLIEKAAEEFIRHLKIYKTKANIKHYQKMVDDNKKEIERLHKDLIELDPIKFCLGDTVVKSDTGKSGYIESVSFIKDEYDVRFYDYDELRKEDNSYTEKLSSNEIIFIRRKLN